MRIRQLCKPLRYTLWWLLDYAYAAQWQVRAVFNRTRSRSFLTGHKMPVVILPGVYESWKFMQPLIEQLHELGHPVHVLKALRHNRVPVHRAADRVTAYLERFDITQVILVAHSKGGLAGKLVMIGSAGSRVAGMLAIATPFHGSRYARITLSPTIRALSPRDPTILRIAQQQDPNARIVSVFGQFDPHIPEGSELAGARNVRIATGGHFRILAHPQVIEEFIALTGRVCPLNTPKVSRSAALPIE